MRMTRCPIDLALHAGQTVTLPEEAANHLVRVMRLREGDGCVLFNGDGHDYTARVVLASKREVQVRIDTVQAVANESPLAITLLQGIARGEKMDLILQKATELGVTAILPVNAERTEVKLDAARAEKRVAHWNSVVQSACGQSGRARIPPVAAPQSLAQAAAGLPADTLRLTLDPLGSHRLSTLQQAPAGGIVIAIGPEGGWSPRDRAQLAADGFQGLQLGPRILRTETAGLAAIAALQARLGDLG
ncbi:16S rRNA (uracil(1498)-N(3))-methyltransferase [Stenotrophomonas sp. 24(2023)]|uniref:16S rRNA (uracil(1498)-N(3))-methyltransferase n=1 Tax=Stenotrophomonas sp. 24(2023) TaxID=3068324 RepID=UPI0027E02ED1|nr:16S rRNA (uracil(1498)-N(3))-methyltransferase [Stenotrophomonas sp. 24(2023)]WMJ70195.1 16S rRNA (uracil(1498)-N(3))-methyltransferase [Stenotrophomonas sp. 24(2023)]